MPFIILKYVIQLANLAAITSHYVLLLSPFNLCIYPLLTEILKSWELHNPFLHPFKSLN